jgi:hypothetical protein
VHDAFEEATVPGSVFVCGLDAAVDVVATRPR